ncbi:HNH endonuclease [Neobacillus drentensis]|uniref:HNH endonuclease n=1 Tax=Neobacillus drentensis TaxID=220684 RepID=UPI001F3504A0|nr:HNH endonuclease [Neobacillus drentensis]ULT55437.1 HNH endonuclease [Neobacillus drentensis]
MSRVISEERKEGNKLRSRVLARDGYMCRLCGSEENLEVHHMLALVNGGNSTMKNLITLCADCHYYAPENGKEANEEYLRQRNLVIYEHLITYPGPYAKIAVAYMEFLKDRSEKYVNLGFIDEEQKEKIIRYELNNLVERGTAL